MLTLPLSRVPWTFREAAPRKPWREAVVPGCVHRDLLRHGLIPDPFWACNELGLQWIEERAWEYRTTFSVSDELLTEETIELVADGLDTVATVTLNGEKIAAADNMFIGHRWEVKRHLRPGRNELHVHFASAMDYIRTHRTSHRPREFNDPVGGCTVIRKQQCQFGWDWGPRLVTAGIWRDIRLEGWTANRLESVRIAQTHHTDGSVTLALTPELARPGAHVLLRGTVSLDGRHVATVTDDRALIPEPRLWWPNGHGAQPLYTVEVEALDTSGRFIGSWKRTIGLRTIALDRHKDTWGQTFQFVVNGRPLFAKGANWIPAHSFVAGLRRADYERDLRAARDAHLNMVRVWGGGVYESEDFHDLCDELGLLVWQDFMFACTLYPGDDAFVASVREEAAQQVRRLRHRASLALWCGNNEIFSINHTEIAADASKRAAYDRVFHQTLPTVVAAHDGATTYWPSSPWRGDDDITHAAGEMRGDTHFWDVWHARRPVGDYTKHAFRFVSEFGMQSYPSNETQATFAPPGERNVFGSTLRNHQKNAAGNQIILDYVSRLYRFPKHQDFLPYLSQLNQAHCMQVGVEFYRRNMPRCMGALYWQLNDCWPTASWSSIEFTGRWRALHHIARRFFAPALVSAEVPGEESDTIGNYRQSTIHQVRIHTVYDAPKPATGRVSWEVRHLDGRRLLRGGKRVLLRYGESLHHHTLDLTRLIARHGRDELYVRLALDVADRRVSETTAFVSSPRFLNLPRGKTRTTIALLDAGQARLTFTSTVFQHRFVFDLPGISYATDDSYFDLHPGEPRAVTITLANPVPAARLRRQLVHHSLVDTY